MATQRLNVVEIDALEKPINESINASKENSSHIFALVSCQES